MLKQRKIVYNFISVINVYVTFRLRKRTINNTKFLIGNCLFGSVKIQKKTPQMLKNTNILDMVYVMILIIVLLMVVIKMQET